jgi:hypothetical protein
LGNYQGATREELLGNYQGATREELLGDPFNLSSAQPYMDIYQSSMDPAVREIEKQTLQAQNQARATAARSGSFGGSRLGIIEGTAAGEGSRAAGDLEGCSAAKEGLGFAAGRYDTDRAARAATENTMRNRFTQDQQSRFGAEDVMRGQFTQDQQSRFGAEDVMRGQFLEDRQGRMSVEDARRAQAEIMTAQHASARRTSCMAATATNVPHGSALEDATALLGSRQTKPLALHK